MEQEALLNVWTENYHKFFCKAISVLKNIEAVEDALQNAVLKAWRKRDTIQSEGSCYAWLSRIVFNECISYIRKEKKHISVLNIEEVLATLSSGPEEIEEFALQITIEDISSGIPERCQMVLRLCCDGYCMEDIAEVLGIPVGTVKSQLHHTRKTLRTSMAGMTI